MTVTGVILAGGQSRRMGTDKALLILGGETLLSRAVACARPQVDTLLINARNDAARFAAFACPVIADSAADFQGPLAGILTALDWVAQHRPGARWLVSFPCDSPFLPMDMATRLIRAAAEADAHIAVAASKGRRHPVCAAWRIDTRASLAAAFHAGTRRVEEAIRQHRAMSVAFDAEPDPFFNINTPDDLAAAERLLRP